MYRKIERAEQHCQQLYRHVSLRHTHAHCGCIRLGIRICLTCTYSELRDECHTVGHVHGRVPVLSGGEKVLELIGVQIHVLDLGKDLVNLEKWVGGRPQSQCFPDGISVTLALPAVLTTNYRTR